MKSTTGLTLKDWQKTILAAKGSSTPNLDLDSNFLEYFSSLRTSIANEYARRYDRKIIDDLYAVAGTRKIPDSSKLAQNLGDWLFHSTAIKDQDAALFVAGLIAYRKLDTFPDDEKTLLGMPEAHERSNEAVHKTRVSLETAAKFELKLEDAMITHGFQVPEYQIAERALQRVMKGCESAFELQALYSAMTMFDHAVEDMREQNLPRYVAVSDAVLDAWEILTFTRSSMSPNYRAGAYLDLIIRDLVLVGSKLGSVPATPAGGDDSDSRVRAWFGASDPDLTSRLAEWIPLAEIFGALPIHQVNFLHRMGRIFSGRFEKVSQLATTLAAEDPDPSELKALTLLLDATATHLQEHHLQFILGDRNRLTVLALTPQNNLKTVYSMLNAFAQKDILVDGEMPICDYLTTILQHQNAKIRSGSLSLLTHSRKIFEDRNSETILRLYRTSTEAALATDHYFHACSTPEGADLFLQCCLNVDINIKDLCRAWKKLEKQKKELFTPHDPETIRKALTEAGISFDVKVHEPEKLTQVPALSSYTDGFPDWYKNYCTASLRRRETTLSAEDLQSVGSIVQSVQGWNGLEMASWRPNATFNAFSLDLMAAHANGSTLWKTLLHTPQLLDRYLDLVSSGNTQCREAFINAASETRNPHGTLARLLVPDGYDSSRSSVIEYRYTPSFDSPVKNPNFNKVILVGYNIAELQNSFAKLNLGFHVECLEPDTAARRSHTFNEGTLVILLTKIIGHSEAYAIANNPGGSEVKLLHERGRGKLAMTLHYLSTIPTE